MSDKTDTPPVNKPKYEAPALIELGALARSVGGSTCSFGSSPSGSPCSPGNTAAALCSMGLSVT